MSKDLFLIMREQEVNTDNFLPTKKELQRSSKDFVNKLLNDGELDSKELYSQAVRLKESLTVIEQTLKESFPDENFEAFGIKGTFKNGGDIKQYSECPIFKELENKLKQRKELLNTAYGSDSEIYDSEGLLVPKVSTKPRKSSLNITF